MKDWISLFETYKIDGRLLASYQRELSTLSNDSPRRQPLISVIEKIEKKQRALEALLDVYDDRSTSAREAVRRSEERLFLTYHYVRGMTMEETADEMKVSRDTVYRIRRRIVSRADAPDVHPDEEWTPLLFPPPPAPASPHSPSSSPPPPPDGPNAAFSKTADRA